MIKHIKNGDTFPITERRRFIRHPLCYPLTYNVISPGASKGRKEVRSKTINVGLGGLLFAAKHPAKTGDMIKIKMPFEDKVFIIDSKVVTCTKNTETNLYNIGVSFYRFKDAYKVKLVEQIYLIAEYRDLRSIQLGKEISLEEASREWIRRYSERFKNLYW
ncbi:MAG: PilZ domain-containing protein [Candidatus Omnitrophica bacterium]|nr:PilZ domain-containing protein [Candidatus Omnitrophota bacterium]